MAVLDDRTTADLAAAPVAAALVAAAPEKLHVAAFKQPYETARQMGHIDGLRSLYKSYVAFVPQAVAERYWALRPTMASAADKVAA